SGHPTPGLHLGCRQALNPPPALSVTPASRSRGSAHPHHQRTPLNLEITYWASRLVARTDSGFHIHGWAPPLPTAGMGRAFETPRKPTRISAPLPAPDSTSSPPPLRRQAFGVHGALAFGPVAAAEVSG